MRLIGIFILGISLFILIQREIAHSNPCSAFSNGYCSSEELHSIKTTGL